MISDNRTEIALRLSEYRERGEIDFKKVLAVPARYRIPGLVATKEGKRAVLSVLTVYIAKAMNQLNLKYPMNADQVATLALTIINQSQQDQLAMEDVMLFLQKLIAGEYGPVEFKMDSPTFFKYFEAYREDRFQANESMKDEQHVNYKSLGKTGKEGDLTWGDLLHKTDNLRDR